MCHCTLGEGSELDELPTDGKAVHGAVKYSMRKSSDLDQDGCFLQVGKKECLEECGFNATAKTIFIIHGWTVCKLKICIWLQSCLSLSGSLLTNSHPEENSCVVPKLVFIM